MVMNAGLRGSCEFLPRASVDSGSATVFLYIPVSLPSLSSALPEFFFSSYLKGSFFFFFPPSFSSFPNACSKQE